MLDFATPLEGIRSPFGRRQGGAAFSPTALFALAEPGVWFDPSDLTTLFADPAGTTPVTTPGNTVGLMLDKSKGLALGAELVANGDFNDPTTTGWTAYLGASLSVDSARLKITSAGGSSYTLYAITTVVGKWYKFIVGYDGTAFGGGMYIYPASTTGGAPLVASTPLITGAGTTTLHFAATGTTSYILVQGVGMSAGQSIFADNISVRELAGNHATQATIAARPTYSIEPVGGRRNLLTFSEQIENAVWLKFNPPTITSDDTAAPNGTVTADRVTAASTSKSAIYQTNSVSGAAARLSIYAKLGTARFLWMEPTSTTPTVWFDLQNPASVSSNTSGGTASIVPVGTDGWYLCSVAVGASGPNFSFGFSNASGSTNQTSGQYSWVWGAQLELGSTATAYQRVTTQHDVTEAGVASVGYLYFDGASDAMATSTITPGTDKVQVFSGITKPTATSTYGLLYGLGNTASGGFETFVPDSSATQVEFFMQGFGMLTCGIPSAPFSAVLTQAIDRALPLPQISARLNGAALSGTSSGSAQTGNFLAFPLYIGARGGVSLPFSGHLYSLITRFGPTLDAATIASTEVWVGDKTGIDIAKITSTTIYTRSGDTILDRANSTIERRAV